MTNESRRADDLRQAYLREAGLPIPRWSRVPGDEQAKWRAKARAQSVNGTDAATTARRSGFTPASEPQRESIRKKGCIVCGSTECDPAHIIDRLMGGDDDPRAVVALCRHHHRDYDDGHLSLLELLEPHYRAELAYAVETVGLITALERITNDRWMVDPAGARGQKDPSS